MARKKTSKSDHIRKALEELGPAARNRDIIEKLAGEKITVSAQMVSTVRARAGSKSASRNGAKKPGRPRKSVGNGSVSLAALLTAKQLVADSGSLEAAKATLQVLGQLA